jgi:adenosylcobinamide-phosphate synthase
MGNAIQGLERPFRHLPLPLGVSGILFAGILVSGTWGACRALLAVAGQIHPLFADIVETLLIYYSLSARSLHDAAMAIFRSLQGGRLNEAREKTAMIVGRDVETLDEEKITKAAVESVAENLVDGFIAPFFYAAIGGAPLAMAYKMVNTLDSMIGYKSDAYIAFGKAAARIDDAANFIPARFSPPVVAAAAQLLAQKGGATLKTAFREGRQHTSPNAGFPEAAFAGALGITLGGPSHYQNVWVRKPEIGTGLKAAAFFHIPRACGLMLLSAVLWGFFIIALAAL